MKASESTMAFSEKTFQPVISTKRPSDDADDCKLDEFRKPKTLVRNRKYAPPKIRVGFEAIRDFPPGCGIIHDSLESIVERKPLKKLDNVDSKDKTMKVNSLHFEDNKPNSSKPKALGFNKPSFGSKPYRKTKYWDPSEQVVRDHPPACGIKEEKKPLKNANNADSNLKKMNSNAKEKLVNHHHPCENTQLKSFKPKELANTKPSSGSKPAGKVKFYDPTCSKDDDTRIPKDANTIDSRRRKKIHDAMILFEKVHTQLFQENRSKQQGEKMAHWRVSVEAARIVKQKLRWMTPEKASGEIRGVHPGDMFKFRSQLHMVGLHCQQHSGIDYTMINGKNVAISVVDSHRYSKFESESSQVLMYSGEGGGGVQFGFLGSRQVAPEDQKLVRGNLALKNSMKEKSPVRVIKKLCGVGFGKKKTDVFVYDGLYTVNHYTQKRILNGKLVFIFEMHKIPGQSQSQSQSQPQFQKRVNANAMRGDVALYQHSTFQMLK